LKAGVILEHIVEKNALPEIHGMPQLTDAVEAAAGLFISFWEVWP
jgi:hypothetical protein